MKTYKDIRTLWVADYSVKHNKGGAQQTNQEMIKYGRSKGIYIKQYTKMSLYLRS